MQSLKSAFRFIDASFSLALENPHMQKPWLYLGLGALGILLIWFLPLALVVGLLGYRAIGLILIGLISILIIMSLLIWGEHIVLQTSQIFASITKGGEDQPKAESQKAAIFSHWFDVFIFALTLPGIQFIQLIRKIVNRDEESPPVWLDAHFLILPIIALEDMDLEQAEARVKQIVGNHLLRFRPGFIGVKLIAHLVQWLLIAAGVGLGYLVAVNIADPLEVDPWRRIMGAGIGMAWGGLLVVMGSSFSTYSRACYYSALYLWIRNVEAARAAGESVQSSPPKILREVLGMHLSSKKER